MRAMMSNCSRLHERRREAIPPLKCFDSCLIFVLMEERLEMSPGPFGMDNDAHISMRTLQCPSISSVEQLLDPSLARNRSRLCCGVVLAASYSPKALRHHGGCRTAGRATLCPHLSFVDVHFKSTSGWVMLRSVAQ